MHQGGFVWRDIYFEDADVLVFERQTMMRLDGDFDLRNGLAKQIKSEKQNGKMACANHGARF